jgi:hypothetical protein
MAVWQSDKVQHFEDEALDEAGYEHLVDLLRKGDMIDPNEE